MDEKKRTPNYQTPTGPTPNARVVNVLLAGLVWVVLMLVGFVALSAAMLAIVFYLIRSAR